jgi:SRSO17 transposase
VDYGKYSRLPQAPSEPLPELDAFLKPLHVHFVRSESRHAMERDLTGLLTEHPNKNCDTLAQVVPDTSEQSLQGLLTTMRWDEQALNNQRVARLHALKTEGDGVLVIDDMGFPKQGKDSVGVARQYSGALGKGDNCQVTVNLTYAERPGAWPLATRLYLPATWARDVERRTKAHLPDEVRFQTKAEIALDLLDWALEQGLPFAAVTSGADYVEYAHRRHQVERFHQDAKTLLGWDQYQGRRWDGFHRHAVLVMLAYSFLVWTEWHQRAHRGKPGRRAFSPSAGSPSPIAGGGPATPTRLAAPACH